eukprot:3813778-Amphidinium_carterae.3
MQLQDWYNDDRTQKTSKKQSRKNMTHYTDRSVQTRRSNRACEEEDLYELERELQEDEILELYIVMEKTLMT